ncbi:MAG TPA: tetratricopeptide repeat protein [Vicinamibacterales bacterium]|nr:tetratricopeptide repeat protein [Vicinamibacterales bacterium]
MSSRWVLPIGAVVATVMIVGATLRDARETAAAPVAAPVMPVTLTGTTRTELTSTVSEMTERLKKNSGDAVAVVSLTNALIRLQRVNNDGRAVIAAEEHLRAFLKAKPEHYEARRMLAAVLLSQHRFGDAIAEANAAMAIDPRDAWNYGVAGDGYMELGNYEKAFEAFDRMGQLQPGPPAYARTAYALELKGDLEGALEYMRKAAEGTSPNDAESQAWHYAQVGDLLYQLGRYPLARLEYERADATFPGHPMAVVGQARIRMSDGDLKGARLLLQTQLARTATPDLAAAVGELSLELGDATMAEQYFQMAEQIERGAWGNGARQPQAMARLLADRPGREQEAVTLAEEAARSRADIFTMDTLAWAYYKSGRLADAKAASERALRTGTRDARIRCHAEIIGVASPRHGDAISERAPASTRHCLEWRP